MKYFLKQMIILIVIVVSAQFGSTFCAMAANDYESHWAAAAITKWVQSGVINGYPDGSFKPDDPITRAEFVTILDKIMGYSASSASIFTDVEPDDWYYDAVNKAGTAGIVQGNNGFFRPNDRISRQEAAVIFYNAYKLTGSSSSSSNFNDGVQIASWASNQVSMLFDLGYINGRSSTEFAPFANLTRAEAVKMIDNISTISPSIAVSTGPTTESTSELISAPKTEITEPDIASPETNVPEDEKPEKSSITLVVKDLQPSVITVATGVYNLVFTQDCMMGKIPTLNVSDKLDLMISGSASTNYDLVYIDNIPSIDGPGWLAFNIQGVTEAQMLAGTIDWEY